MILTIGGVINEWGGSDLSMYVDRTSFEVSAAAGRRIDTCRFTLADPNLALAVPQRAEIVVYDAPAPAQTWVAGTAPVVDPPAANTAPLGYTWDNFAWDSGAQYDTIPPYTGPLARFNPQGWTPRLFGGYVGTADYSLDGAQRYIQVSAQDYTVHNKYTVVNRAYAPDFQHPQGWSDAQIVRDLYLAYRPDIDVTQVQTIIAAMPAISFPVHTMEQFMERVTKLSQAVYRVDYYRRLQYAPIGATPAPLAISDTPAASASAPDYRSTVLADQPWLYYRLGDLGSTIADSSGNGNSGSVSGSVTRTVLPMGLPNDLSGAMGFDGATTMVQSAWAPGSPLTAFTLEAWVSVASAGGGLGWVAGFVDSTGHITGLYASVVSGQVRWELAIAGNGPGSASGYSLDAWHHVLVTVGPSGGATGRTHQLALWVDGVRDPFQSPADGYADNTVASPLYAGGMPSHGVPTLLGSLSDVALWQTALDDTAAPRHHALVNAPAANTVGGEGITHSPDSSDAVDRAWVVGGTFAGNSQSFPLRPLPDGVQTTFPLPDALKNAYATTVTVNGVDQGQVGVLGVDGTLDNTSGWQYAVLLGKAPPMIAFATAPPVNQPIVVTGVFQYPLIQIVTDTATLASMRGEVFETVVRDKRIDSIPLAQQVGLARLAVTGTQHHTGSLTITRRGWGGQLLQPGQQMAMKNAQLFAGLLPTAYTTVLVNQLTTKLTDDIDDAYEVQVSYSDVPDLGDSDMVDMFITEQSRVNAALEQQDTTSVVDDTQTLPAGGADPVSFAAESLTVTTQTPGTATWDSAAQWDFFTYA